MMCCLFESSNGAHADGSETGSVQRSIDSREKEIEIERAVVLTSKKDVTISRQVVTMTEKGFLVRFSGTSNYLPKKRKSIDRQAAHYLAYTCALTYPDQKTGLGPEQMTTPREGRRWMDVVNE